MFDKKYFGFVSYFAAMAVMGGIVWFWVGMWILAVIPHILFGGFCLSVFVGTVWMYFSGKMTTERIKIILASNFTAFLSAALVLSVLYFLFR